MVKRYSTSLMTTLFSESNPLTHKEQVVLKEIGNGLSSKEIVEKLYLSNGTVRIIQVRLLINVL